MTEHQQQRGRIIGIGGVFFKSNDHERLREWYTQKLGVGQKDWGEMFKWRSIPDAAGDQSTEHLTTWSIFPGSSTYFDPSHAPFMINYIVDDLDAFLAKAAENGVRIDPKRDNTEYGRFAWIYDLDDNKIELWEPPRPA